MPTHSSKTILLASDQQKSILAGWDENQPQPSAYTPYGYRPMADALITRFGFAGAMPDPLTGHYHLGNGYRPFNPILMCFNSPDSLSPFGKGGINAYAYCGRDPVNRVDPTGRSWLSRYLGSAFRSVFGKSTKTKNKPRAGKASSTAASDLSDDASDILASRGYVTYVPQTPPPSPGSSPVPVRARKDIPDWQRMGFASEEVYKVQLKKAPTINSTVNPITSVRRQSVAQPIAKSTSGTIQYSDPKAAARIQRKLLENEKQNNKEWLMDDYYYKKSKYEQQLAKLEIRSS